MSGRMIREDVAPFVGAWIEIGGNGIHPTQNMSLPSWERGLKLHDLWPEIAVGGVAPFVGAWIEIYLVTILLSVGAVAPFVGAWIEIYNTDNLVSRDISRSLRGSVD